MQRVAILTGTVTGMAMLSAALTRIRDATAI